MMYISANSQHSRTDGRKIGLGKERSGVAQKDLYGESNHFSKSRMSLKGYIIAWSVRPRGSEDALLPSGNEEKGTFNSTDCACNFNHFLS